MRAMRFIRTESARLVCTDPPYGIGYQNHQGESVLNDERPFIWWLAEAYRITMPGGALICFTRWDVQEQFRMAIECAGFSVKSQLIWDKRAHGMGDCSAQFAPNHEVMWFATKDIGRAKYKFPGPRPGSIVTETRPHNTRRFHPTEKPVGLLAQLIRSTTSRGELVVDPFSGSGSCGVACVRESRRFIGIELDGRYVNRSRQRIAEARGKGTLFGEEHAPLIDGADEGGRDD